MNVIAAAGLVCHLGLRVRLLEAKGDEKAPMEESRGRPERRRHE